MIQAPIVKQTTVYGVVLFADEEPLTEYDTIEEAAGVCNLAGAGFIVYKIRAETGWNTYRGER